MILADHVSPPQPREVEELAFFAAPPEEAGREATRWPGGSVPLTCARPGGVGMAPAARRA